MIKRQHPISANEERAMRAKNSTHNMHQVLLVPWMSFARSKEPLLSERQHSKAMQFLQKLQFTDTRIQNALSRNAFNSEDTRAAREYLVIVNQAARDMENQISDFEQGSRSSEPLNLLLHSQNLGKRMVFARLRLHWSQNDLARRCNLARSVIQRYEKHFYASATLERVSAICSVLNSALEKGLDE